MHIKIETNVEQNLEQVWHQFNEKLLLKLSPPFPIVRILSFGHKIGEKVTIELNFFILRQIWISIITDSVYERQKAYFIDEGIKLPFFLSNWKHQHIIEEHGSGCKIIDEIEFRTPTILTDYIFYPILYLQFLYRKPIYRKIFKKT
ncbi:hypothetical protein Emtol_3273 [Emticicia oligotrophica DSM 17448]|uniref:Ligand-binding SRPBCC domain-containing protein n=1 Tax=Emticicia oligotrophica (strain DSM 17448 / CIP 109782 / MTCC 6937 / GPTSA100-15) TaxID=929562 RepID=A0ABM5N4G4_EMTOG|nr:hypothetical protein [Emticicia oligotrophica]AFK04402.1 hypothetical protein Emtol_3273 [Emticicia oligotrophica DSM 17448]